MKLGEGSIRRDLIEELGEGFVLMVSKAGLLNIDIWQVLGGKWCGTAPFYGSSPEVNMRSVDAHTSG